MLPARARLRARADFTATVRQGRRGRSELVLVHLMTASGDADGPARAGFVVSRALGPAVVRNQVKRRLRSLVAARLDLLPDGSRLVVRALPPAAAASSAQLGTALDRALRRVLEGSR